MKTRLSRSGALLSTSPKRRIGLRSTGSPSSSVFARPVLRRNDVVAQATVQEAIVSTA